MLKELRKKYIKNPIDLDSYLGKKWTKWEIEKKFESNKFFKYIVFLRKNGAKIDDFLDNYIKNKNNE